MKHHILIIFLTVFNFCANAQNSNPYEVFGHNSTVNYNTPIQEKLYIINNDTNAEVKAMAFDIENNKVILLGFNDTIIKEINIEANQLLRWLSVDPKAKEFPEWSPYAAMGDNPIRNIDPDGQKFLNFDKAGNYTGTTKDNLFHNFFVGTKGRVINTDGSVQQKFKFANPSNDAKDIQKGTITKLVFVNDVDIKLMVAMSGGFEHDNKTANRKLSERYSYIMSEGVGGHKMDFSYTHIPDLYPDASKTPLDPKTPSPLIFLVDNVAHNQMNFGNFMFGASGTAMGFFPGELLTGADYNSLNLNRSGKNGYKPQLDSRDDQFSMQLGMKFANKKGYEKQENKVKAGPLSPPTR
ncbi:MAG: hypothetical protein KA275_04660 [Chitinophagaceae bacterium]|nr:hypothetical protein [Chitinophagaceae bacterium]